MKRPCRANKQCFTLVEMAIAMAVLVVVALIIGTASATFYNGYRRSVKVTERLKTCQAIDRLMDQNVRNLIPFKWNDELNSSRFVFEGKSDSLHFTTLRRTYGSDRGALLFVRIRVENDELIAEYSSYPRLPWEDEGAQEYAREVIATKVRGIRFLYGEQGDDEIEFEESWEEDDHGSTPLAIQMTVEWLDGTSEQWLRRTAGSSSNSTFGSRATPVLQ
ncbi:MAG: prepilin-type N-terminal cleavage/methylation domain-containing protein [Lentisphaeria bacterium]|nr:prepilin-type N-terminal cleavage/methylation domain-containing protein [Lentisphaeria bacterium]